MVQTPKNIQFLWLVLRWLNATQFWLLLGTIHRQIGPSTPILTRTCLTLFPIPFNPVSIFPPFFRVWQKYHFPDITSSITYSSSASITDSGPVDAYFAVDDTQLVPIQQIAAPDATKTIQLVAAFDTMDDGTNHAMFNEITYNSPLVPAILSEMTLGSNATVEEAYGPLSFVVDHLDVVDIVIQNSDTGDHPLYVFLLWFLTVLLTYATTLVQPSSWAQVDDCWPCDRLHVWWPNAQSSDRSQPNQPSSQRHCADPCWWICYSSCCCW